MIDNKIKLCCLLLSALPHLNLYGNELSVCTEFSQTIPANSAASTNALSAAAQAKFWFEKEVAAKREIDEIFKKRQNGQGGMYDASIDKEKENEMIKILQESQRSKGRCMELCRRFYGEIPYRKTTFPNIDTSICPGYRSIFK